MQFIVIERCGIHKIVHHSLEPSVAVVVARQGRGGKGKGEGHMPLRVGLRKSRILTSVAGSSRGVVAERPERSRSATAQNGGGWSIALVRRRKSSQAIRSLVKGRGLALSVSIVHHILATIFFSGNPLRVVSSRNDSRSKKNAFLLL